MNEILETLSLLIKNNTFLAPIIALIAGILTSFSPCSLSTLPLIIAYIGGSKTENPKKAFKLSLVFATGMAITFTILGILASLLGKLMQGTGGWWYIILGILMILMALQTFELITFIKPTYLQNKNTKKGYIGALLTGILGGIFSSPCATPILVVLLAIVAQNGNLLFGTILLLIYSIGNSILIVICGTSIGLIKKITTNKKYEKINSLLKYLIGFAILLIAFYMFYLGF